VKNGTFKTGLLRQYMQDSYIWVKRQGVICLRQAMEWLVVQQRAGSSMCGYYWFRPALATLIPVFHFGLKYGAFPFIPFPPPCASVFLSKHLKPPGYPENPTPINPGTLAHSARAISSQTRHSRMWMSDSWFVRIGLIRETYFLSSIIKILFETHLPKGGLESSW
jgi:hypothetical protein